MKKPTASAASGSADSNLMPDSKLRKSYPQVSDYLTMTKWDDGTARTPSTVTLFVEGGVLKAALNDREMKRSLYVTSMSLEGAIGLLEEALATDTADWRLWSGGSKKK